MGSTCTCQTTAVEVNRSRIRTQRMGNFTFQLYGKPHLEGQVTGTGCKKTLVWTTASTAEAVMKKRNEFWETRVDGSSTVWKVLHAAILEPNPAEAEAMIKAAGLKMTNGLMLQVYDNLGHRYDVPPYVINEPAKYGKGPLAPSLPIGFNEKTISFTLRSAKYSDLPLEVLNSTAVEWVRQKYSKEKAVNEGNVLLFYNGKELKDGFTLGHYKIEEGIVIQILLKPVS